MDNILELRNHIEFTKRCFYNIDSGKYQIKTLIMPLLQIWVTGYLLKWTEIYMHL